MGKLIFIPCNSELTLVFCPISDDVSTFTNDIVFRQNSPKDSIISNVSAQPQ